MQWEGDADRCSEGSVGRQQEIAHRLGWWSFNYRWGCQGCRVKLWVLSQACMY